MKKGIHMKETNDMLHGLVLDPPNKESGPSYWVGKAGGDGPGWTLSPSKRGRLKIPKRDAERIMEHLPLVAVLKIEEGWKPSIVKIGPKYGGRGRGRPPRRDRPNRDRPRELEPAPPAPVNGPLDLLRQVEALRVRAVELASVLDVETSEGYWTGDVQSVLARLSRQGAQLLLGGESQQGVDE